MTDRAQTVSFVLDGHVVDVVDPSPTETLLSCLRGRLGRYGVKEGCAEGDCGACTVVLGEAAGESIVYRAVNACIRFLPTVDGREVVTAESLVAPDGALHPVQQALVDCHASQCGFCTPGFVMSLFALWLQNCSPTREAVLGALSGNLCRCTGYRPIIEAGLAAAALAEPGHWGRADAQSTERRKKLEALAREQPLVLQSGAGFVAPRSLDEMAGVFAANPEALILAGGTDIGLWVTKHLRELPMIIYLGEVAELKLIRHEPDALVIGAGVTLSEAFDAIGAQWPELSELAERFASPPVCNSGTLCGNIANGSPIGDSMPALLALGASLELRRGPRSRSVPLDEFYLGYRKTALEPGEFVAAVRIVRRAPVQRFACWKVSKRIDQDISAVCAAVSWREHEGVVIDVRMGFGGMAAIPARARHAERALIGKSLSYESLAEAGQALAQDFAPMTDMRASADYRLRVAASVLLRLLHENQGDYPSRLTQVCAESA